MGFLQPYSQIFELIMGEATIRQKTHAKLKPDGNFSWPFVAPDDFCFHTIDPHILGGLIGVPAAGVCRAESFITPE